jgi:hypothetical protein
VRPQPHEQVRSLGCGAQCRGGPYRMVWSVDGSEAGAMAEQSQHVILYVVVPVASIGAGMVFLALLAAFAGLIFLVPALIRRIQRRKLRLAAGWITGLAAAAATPYLAQLLFFTFLNAAMSADHVRLEAAGGQSVLVTQDPFDGDIVDVYTRQDNVRYRWIRSAPELAGWPRVKDQDCRLEADGDELQRACGAKVLSLRPEEFERPVH